MQHLSIVRGSMSSSLVSSAADTDHIDHSGTETSGISSRISLRHGLSVDRLRLLSANPPETKITNLSELGSCSNSINIDSNINTTAGDPTNVITNDLYPANDTSSHTRSTNTMIDNETGTHVEKHPDLWFEDGSVICRAENTLFCVHMSQLARHSLVFNDMFMLPQESGPEDSMRMGPFMTLSGLRPGTQLDMSDNNPQQRTTTRTVPVVYLYDAAEDVANLFTALYDGPSFGNNEEVDFRLVSGILRLSTKYLIDSLRAKALSHLAIAWPDSLKAWDAREDLARHWDGSKRIRYPHPACVINLAREVDAPYLLPAAFYDISRHSFAQIFEPNEDDPLYLTDQPPPSLSPHDTQRLCLGKEASQQTITTLIQSLGNGRYPRLAAAAQKSLTRTHINGKRGSLLGLVCVSASVCRKDFEEFKELATQHYLFDRESGYCDPLYVAEELGQLKSAEFSECKACANALESWACKEREKMWKMIPYWFRLEVSGSSPGLW